MDSDDNFKLQKLIPPIQKKILTGQEEIKDGLKERRQTWKGWKKT